MYYIGVDVGGTNLVAGLVNDAGAMLHKVATPVNRALSDVELCEEIVALALRLCEDSGAEQAQISAVGIGFPGLVDNGQGVVIQTPNMPFSNTDVRAAFQARWQVPVYLGNDANCAALGEYWAGAAKGCSPAVMVTLGTGIGGGMVADGKLFTGCAGGGLEVGHVITHPNGQPCGCGNLGCWEQYGSATALIRMTREAMQDNPTTALWQLCQGDLDRVQGRTPFQAAEMGDAVARRVLEHYIDELSVGLVGLINILQPQVICLGGGISHAADELLLNPLRELAAWGSFDKTNPTRLVKATLGNDAGVVGAALLCKAL